MILRQKSLTALSTLLVVLLFTQCYSCRGIALPTGAETVFVDIFDNNIRTAHPPTLAIQAAEALKEKLQNQARLRIVNNRNDADLEFKGTLVDYRVTSEAPQAGEFTRQNVLTINTAVEYINLKAEEPQVWKSNFSWQEPFPGDVALRDIETDAIVNILDVVTEQIINKAFTEDW
ncbi:MAG: LPS assembly lipoprotein LptE [Bacteroidota bacterium]